MLSGLFSSTESGGYSLVAVRRLLIVVASLVATEHKLWGAGFSSCNTWSQ